MKQVCFDFLMAQFGDKDVVNEIYGEFAQSFPGMVEEAAGHVAAGEWEKLDRVAHALKGNSLVVGHSEAADAAIALRRAAKLADTAEANALVGKLREFAADL